MGCGNNCGNSNLNRCPDKNGCPPGVCPDFVIRRHDTRPFFKVKIEDCDGPLDLTDLVLEATMWAKAKLKKAITTEDEYFGLADGIGFNQVMVGDVIVMDRTRLPEKMLVKAFDETNQLIQVQRAYHGTTAQNWKKGSSLKIMKFQGNEATTEMYYEDVIQLDGEVAENQLADSFLIYEWQPNDTCLPGCYYLEFKLLKMSATSEEDTDFRFNLADDITPSFTDPDLVPSDFGCGLGSGVEWVRRFPVSDEGFLIKVFDSPTSEG